MRRMIKIGTIITATTLVVFGATGCVGSNTKKDAQEPTPDNVIEGKHTQVIKMPDGFRNVTATQYIAPSGKCYMVFVTSRGWNQNGTSDYPSLPSGIAAIPC